MKNISFAFVIYEIIFLFGNKKASLIAKLNFINIISYVHQLNNPDIISFM